MQPSPLLSALAVSHILLRANGEALTVPSRRAYANRSSYFKHAPSNGTKTRCNPAPTTSQQRPRRCWKQETLCLRSQQIHTAAIRCEESEQESSEALNNWARLLLHVWVGNWNPLWEWQAPQPPIKTTLQRVFWRRVICPTKSNYTASSVWKKKKEKKACWGNWPWRWIKILGRMNHALWKIIPLHTLPVASSCYVIPLIQLEKKK